MRQTGFVHIPVILILLVIVAVGSGLLISQTENQEVKGTLIAKEGGDSGSSGSSGSESKSDDSKSGSSGSSESKSGSSGSSSSGSSGSGSSGSGFSDSTETKTTTQTGTKIETKTEPQKQKTEVRFGEGEKIKTEVKEGRTRIDVVSGGVKVRYEIRDGRVTIKAETEAGVNVPEQELFKVVDRLDKTGIKVATAGGQLLVARNQIGAVTNFPLQIDLNTNQLIASTSAGTKVLTVLPDQAVQNMLAANVISRLGPPFIRQAVTTGQVTTIQDVVQLGLRNNVPVYEIPGIRDFRLLGFIPISQPVTVVVSAETGQVVATEQSLITRVIDLLSP